jgi:hypothetical protein
MSNYLNSLTIKSKIISISTTLQLISNYTLLSASLNLYNEGKLDYLIMRAEIGASKRSVII